MASPGHALSFLLAASFILAMASASALPCAVYCEVEINMRLYLHRIDAQDQKMVVSSTSPGQFGAIVVNNWAVVDAPTPNATIVARGEGMQLKVSQDPSGWFNYVTIVFKDTRFAGSTLIAMGKGEWAIGGGTGQFANAHGTIKLTLLQITSDGSFIQLDINGFSNPDVVSI
ncbi:unnamed protein product [Alopecurus aequalis]